MASEGELINESLKFKGQSLKKSLDWSNGRKNKQKQQSNSYYVWIIDICHHFTIMSGCSLFKCE